MVPQDPRVQLLLIANHLQYDPGNVLTCEYVIDEELLDDLQTLETSVLWYTEGKGDEDIGVHFFVRRTRPNSKKIDFLLIDLRQLFHPAR